MISIPASLYTDMNAIRRDEDVLDNLHSVYVDQWDWEKIIESSDRNLDYLKSTVMDIVAAVCDTQRTMRAIYPQLQVLPELERQVTFVTAQELEDRYPDLTPKEREHAFVREHHTTHHRHRRRAALRQAARRPLAGL